MIIYKATNLINGKVYVGQTINTLTYRKNQHWREATYDGRKNAHFHNALLKYGLENFSFEIIDETESIEELNERERYWIFYYNSTDPRYGYNKDSGGKSGGRKSQETKEKIGLTTREKWSRPETAQKMLSGLRNGTEIWKEKCKNKRVLFVCPYCGKEEYLPAWEARHKTSCRKECKINHGGYIEQASRASNIASELIHSRNVIRKNNMAIDILNWCRANPDVIHNCPYNAITTGLRPLINYIYDTYGIKDLRSLFICFNVDSRKDFLSYLKSEIS